VFVHGKEKYKKAIETTEKFFSKDNSPIDSLTPKDLEEIEGIIKIDIAKAQLDAGIDVINFLANTQILPSKSEAKKMVQNGGISINRNKVENLQFTVNSSLLLHEAYLLIQKGKKNYYLVKAI
jgi:tyrosyl-tRNA synthetase